MTAKLSELSAAPGGGLLDDLVYVIRGNGDSPLTYAQYKAALRDLPVIGGYTFGAMVNGAPTASLVILRHAFADAVTLPSGLTGSVGRAATAATAQTDFDIGKNGVSIGTLRFAAAGATASFIMASAASFAVGDVITVTAPASPDATLADLAVTFKGQRD